MKKTLIALAAAATVSLGAIGAASAAPNTGLDFTAQSGAAIQKVGYGYGFHYGYRYNYFHYCKRLYYKGFVLGFDWARYKYYRHCDRRY
jgi:hypothetical protein